MFFSSACRPSLAFVWAWLLLLDAGTTARGAAPAKSSTPKSIILPPRTTRASANYALTAETFDAGGFALLSSAAYRVKDTTTGMVGALAASAVYASKGGYAGQLYDVRSLGINAAADSVNEGGTLQLGAAPLLDDGTRLAALPSSAVSWSVAAGPLASISAGGLVTAATVYQNTPATVRANSGGLSGAGTLTVLNVNTDDYGPYAGDGIDDGWQVRYFGFNNPRAGPGVDADGTGQTNLFKYLAGLNPLDPTSRFALAISAVPGQPGRKTLSFSPVYSGRTYTVQYTGSLASPSWTTLNNLASNDDGTTRTVTDLSATAEAARFYRVQISSP